MKVDAVESPPLRSKAYGTWDWRVRAIRWGAVFEYQNWGFVPLVVPAVIVLILAHYDFQKHPRYRDAYLYDASIGYPDTGNTISNGTGRHQATLELYCSTAAMHIQSCMWAA